MKIRCLTQLNDVLSRGNLAPVGSSARQFMCFIIGQSKMTILFYIDICCVQLAGFYGWQRKRYGQLPDPRDSPAVAS